MLKRASKQLVMAAFTAVLIMGTSACGNKTADTDAEMAQNDQSAKTAVEQPVDTAQASGEVSTGDDIGFNFDSSAITPEAAEILKGKARILEGQPDMEVTIEGHCDDRGTNEYNMALGDRRAQSAKDYLVQLGITGDRLGTVSYGEEKPLVPGAQTEEEHARNRRAVIKTGSLAANAYESSGDQSDEITYSVPGSGYHFPKIDSVPFVRDAEIESLGYIFNKRKEENVMIAEGDEVYIKPDPDRKIILGSKYMVYNPMEPVKNRSGQVIGIPHRVNGIVQIVKIEQNHVVAKVVRSFREFKEGSKIAPYKKRSPQIPYVSAPKGIDGDIIMGGNDDVIFAQNQLVFLDMGKNQGIRVGQTYNVYRDLIVPPSNSGEQSTTSPIDFGKLFILDSGENASSAVILKSEKDIDPWEKFRTPVK